MVAHRSAENAPSHHPVDPRGVTAPGAGPASRAGDSLPAVGGWWFLLSGFVGRLPAATVQLGLLLYVTAAGLGLGLAGVTVAATGLGAAVGAPLVGRFVDRFGPLPVLFTATSLQVIGLVGLLLVVRSDAGNAAILACAALIGAANPQVGAMARARWSAIARRRRQPGLISRALGYETACDETSFILGPILAGVLVGLLSPDAAVLTLVGWVLLGQGCFASYLLTHRAPRPADDARPSGSHAAGTVRWSAVLAPMLVCACVGTVFGSTQTALASLNAARGTEAYTGIVYGCMGVGSAIASLVVSRLPQRVPLAARVGTGAVLIGLMCVPLAALPSTPVQIGLFVLVGVGVGTLLVSAFTRAERVAPLHRIASVMTVLTTCLVLGVSFGSGLGGVLSVQPQRGFWLTAAAAVVALAAALWLHATRPAGEGPAGED